MVFDIFKSVNFYKLQAQLHWGPREKAILGLLDPLIENCNKLEFRIIDVGCGPGLLVDAICERGLRYLGIDTDRKSIDYSRIKYDKFKKHVEFIYGDASELLLEFTEKDIFILNGIVHHMNDTQIKKLLNKVSMSGIVLVCDHIKVPFKVSTFHSYIFQMLDKGKYIRNLETFDKISGFDKLDGIEFMIKVLGLPVWPYFAYIYKNREPL